ncbi:NAD-dependent protein deacetylase hst1 [Podospora fimiseda]|uniref:NAD-dependent protein deacetylase hst1 n=1 Tax=Podospora fimiseda TaxID=252190 RepID=A0AAN7BU66_9PEZI|nr:NAD-dependent protein deacetylase hst1 [Podospora fimiseda]
MTIESSTTTAAAARRSKKNSPAASSGETPPPTRKPSTRVKNVVDYDEKRAFEGLSAETNPHHPAGKAAAAAASRSDLNELSDSWETNSLFEDIIEELADDKLSSVEGDPSVCTAGEAQKFRQILRAEGPQVLIKRYVHTGLITAKKLLTAFGIRPPAFLEGAEDHAYYSLLSLALSRELSKRAKLVEYNTVDDAVALLKKSKNVMVITGAGISTSLGIPDFRTAGFGLYSKLAHLGLNDPQEVFDIRVFRQDPSIFYSVARDILPSEEGKFSPTHAFIKLLQEKGKLLTNYSQNIDNLEAKAGIDKGKLVQCHGSFATASCVKCGFQVEGESIFEEIRKGGIPKCGKCAPVVVNKKRKLNKDGTERKQRRRPGDFDSNSDSEFDHHVVSSANSGGGVMKPDITFFGEPLPEEFSKRLTEHDRDKVDLVIVIGTSLKVAPVSEVVPFLPAYVPQIYVSRTPITHINFDVELLGDCDVVVAELCRRAGWGRELKHEMIPEGQKVEVRGWEGKENGGGGSGSRWEFVQVSPAPPVENKEGSSSSSVTEVDEGVVGVLKEVGNLEN